MMGSLLPPLDLSVFNVSMVNPDIIFKPLSPHLVIIKSKWAQNSLSVICLNVGLGYN